MRDGKSIDDVLDTAVDELASGMSMADVLKRHSEYAEELTPLLEYASELTSAPQPDYESSVNSLMKIASRLSREDEREKRKILKFVPRRVALRIAASFAVLFIVAWGSVNASSSSVPGDWFYPVKLITEKVRFILSVNKERRVELRITYSTERLKELVRMFNSGGGVDKEVLRRMLDDAKIALDEGEKLNAPTRNLLLERIKTLTHIQGTTLKEIEGRATPEEKKILRRPIQMCGRMCGRMNGRCMMDDSKSMNSRRKCDCR